MRRSSRVHIAEKLVHSIHNIFISEYSNQNIGAKEATGLRTKTIPNGICEWKFTILKWVRHIALFDWKSTNDG